jgi:hypothetical protein
VTGLDIADDTARMTALTDSVVVTAAPRMPMVGVLRALLLAEAVAGLVLAIGTGIAVMIAEWHPIYLAGFAMATAVMLVLSAASVRRALGQG